MALQCNCEWVALTDLHTLITSSENRKTNTRKKKQTSKQHTFIQSLFCNYCHLLALERVYVCGCFWFWPHSILLFWHIYLRNHKMPDKETTVLFLLCWYIACISNDDDDALNILHSFLLVLRCTPHLHDAHMNKIDEIIVELKHQPSISIGVFCVSFPLRSKLVTFPIFNPQLVKYHHQEMIHSNSIRCMAM